MPNALLWGVIAFVLNFIPYAGPATTLVLLTVVALVSFDGLGKAFAVAGSFLVLTGIEGQLLQPVLVGRRLDLSPLVVLLSLWFGGWLWGIAGVALAVPLLVSVKSLLIELPGAGLQGQAPEEAALPSRPDSTGRWRAAQLFARERRQRWQLKGR
jgi:predicted PurR-regulated permease PerM